jgi:FkbM family methyltransferase
MEEVFDIDFLNKQFKISIHDNNEVLSNIIRATQTYSHGDLIVVDQIVQACDYVLDLGANIGWYSLFAAQIVGDTGKVFAFEPNEKNYKKLLHNIEMNSLTETVLPYPYAILDQNKSGNLKCSLTNFGDHILNPLIDLPHHPGDQLVECICLDDFFQKEKIDPARISLIKLDIQGSEIAAFNGMKKFFANHRPAILTEYSPLHFKALGYSPFDMLSFIDRYAYVPFFIHGEIGRNKHEVLSYLPLQKFIEITNELLNTDGAGIDIILIEKSQVEEFIKGFQP